VSSHSLKSLSLNSEHPALGQWLIMLADLVELPTGPRPSRFNGIMN